MDSNIFDNEKQVDVVVDDSKEKDFLSKEQITKGLIIFFVGTGIGLVVFLLSYLGLCFFDINYVISAILAVIISAFVLNALKIAMGSKESKMQAPIGMVLFIAFLITILIGYQKHGSPIPSSVGMGNTLKSETFIFTGEERWAAHVTLRKGQTYKITVSGVSVNMVNGDKWLELVPSVNPYLIRVETEGSPTFDGISHGKGSRSTVTVEWKE